MPLNTSTTECSACSLMSYIAKPSAVAAPRNGRFASPSELELLGRATGGEAGDGATPPRSAAVHEVRKSLKKIRAALRLVRPVIGDKSYRRENTCFRDAARPLTEVRDARHRRQPASRQSSSATCRALPGSKKARSSLGHGIGPLRNFSPWRCRGGLRLRFCRKAVRSLPGNRNTSTSKESGCGIVSPDIKFCRRMPTSPLPRNADKRFAGLMPAPRIEERWQVRQPIGRSFRVPDSLSDPPLSSLGVYSPLRITTMRRGADRCCMAGERWLVCGM